MYFQGNISFVAPLAHDLLLFCCCFLVTLILCCRACLWPSPTVWTVHRAQARFACVCSFVKILMPIVRSLLLVLVIGKCSVPCGLVKSHCSVHSLVVFVELVRFFCVSRISHGNVHALKIVYAQGLARYKEFVKKLRTRSTRALMTCCKNSGVPAFPIPPSGAALSAQIVGRKVTPCGVTM